MRIAPEFTRLDGANGASQTVWRRGRFVAYHFDSRSPYVPKKKMTQEHKDALARGRAQGRAVREYLSAIERQRTRGRTPDRGTIQKRIEDVQRRIDDEENPAKRVELIQRRLDHEEQLISLDDEPDMEALQDAFVDAVWEYSERKGITYHAWREAGVPAAVLKDGGMRRTRRANGDG
jgi:hypothetical protein